MVSAGGTVLYIVELGGNAIRQLALPTRVVTTVAGSGAAGGNDALSDLASFRAPYGLAIDATSGALARLYVADASNNNMRLVQLVRATCTPGYQCQGGANASTGTGACPAGSYCAAGVPIACPAGVWCDAQTSAASGSGACSAGFWCAAGATSANQVRRVLPAK